MACVDQSLHVIVRRFAGSLHQDPRFLPAATMLRKNDVTYEIEGKGQIQSNEANLACSEGIPPVQWAS